MNHGNPFAINHGNPFAINHGNLFAMESIKKHWILLFVFAEEQFKTLCKFQDYHQGRKN